MCRIAQQGVTTASQLEVTVWSSGHGKMLLTAWLKPQNWFITGLEAGQSKTKVSMRFPPRVMSQCADSSCPTVDSHSILLVHTPSGQMNSAGISEKDGDSQQTIPQP